MKASEANRLAKISISLQKIPEIRHQIKTAVDAGRFEIIVYERINENVKQNLEADGYVVEDISDNIRQEPGTKIKW